MKEKRKGRADTGQVEKSASSSAAPSSKTRITADMLKARAPVAIAADVVQHIHRHARSYMSAEVCGVLIGEAVEETTVIEAAIEGAGASQGGAHVTFTQDTWEHIYLVKDRDFPEKRIVGWYHSHPGFGIFLSQQDLFIHENFFSAPAQVAWVYDPHSDEEGCFGWIDGKVKRLREVRVLEVTALDAPVVGEEPNEIPLAANEGDNPRLGPDSEKSQPKRASSLSKKFFLLLALAVVFVAGFTGGVFLFPRTILLYSLPDGRLLSPDEVHSALERAKERQENLKKEQAQPPDSDAPKP